MNVLFMCVANSARSQLAEGLAKEILGTGVHVESAGSKPSRLHPLAVKVMAEIGLEISCQYSKSIDDLPADFVASLDYVITLCAEEVCPVLNSRAQTLHWPLSDPAGQGSDEEQLARFRRTRDDIRSLLKTWKKTGFKSN